MGTNVSPLQRCLGHGSDKRLVGKRPRAMQPLKWPQHFVRVGGVLICTLGLGFGSVLSFQQSLGGRLPV